MRNIEGSLIIIPKHKYRTKDGKRPYRRTYHPDTEPELESLVKLCEKYAEENKSGFLVVKVIRVVDGPEQRMTLSEVKEKYLPNRSLEDLEGRNNDD